MPDATSFELSFKHGDFRAKKHVSHGSYASLHVQVHEVHAHVTQQEMCLLEQAGPARACKNNIGMLRACVDARVDAL
eukprot:m.276137 g.276137  ORF g.276137 m.276137 type:complete len:77 (+) comp54242_c0_seq1:139-369(+)